MEPRVKELYNQLLQTLTPGELYRSLETFGNPSRLCRRKWRYVANGIVCAACATYASQVGQSPRELAIAWYAALDIAAWFDQLPLTESVPQLAELVREELQRREDRARNVSTNS